ncbi:hypothetical protein NX059_004545 [Plenodomus lindquistii]|nr:hypothetical protein NX059_004545 [Plenodomus lindquistii]KAI8938678.1 hypothetical protein NX059_004545 [Plenodomus lindquistii]
MRRTIGQLATLLIFLSAATTTAAADLELFENENACDRAGGICRNIQDNTCCYVTGRLWGSAGVGFVTSGTLQLYTRQDNIYCSISISNEYNTPVCILSGLDSSVGGAVYRARRVRGTMGGEEVLASQEAELMTIEDGKQYIISHEKQAKIEGFGERRGGDLSAYVKEHADIVREHSNDRGQIEVKAAEKDVEKSTE